MKLKNYSFNGKEVDELTFRRAATLDILKCVNRLSQIEGVTVNAAIGFCFHAIDPPDSGFEESRDAAEQQSMLRSDKHEIRVAPRIVVKENSTRYSEIIYEGSLQVPSAQLRAAILHNPHVLQEVPERLNITINPIDFRRNTINEEAINTICARTKNVSLEISSAIKSTILAMIKENLEEITRTLKQRHH